MMKEIIVGASSIVITALFTWTGANYLGAKELETEKAKLAKESAQNKLEIDKEKNALELEKSKFESKIENYKENLKEAEERINRKNAEIEDRESTLKQLENNLREASKSCSRQAQENNTDDKINKLMTNFSELGADMDEQTVCLNEIEKTKRLKAEAIRSQIITLANANGVTEKYQTFINSTRPNNIQSSKCYK